MGKVIEKQPFHLHLEQCEQCRKNPMNLCSDGHNLLVNRTYDTPTIVETAFCFTCQKSKPKDQVETRELTNKDGYKSGVARCIPCWEMRPK